MKRLKSFSVENENLILLRWNDGTTSHIAPEQLGRYLNRRDLAKVRRAVNLRQHYIRTNLPPWALGVAVSLLVVTVAATNLKFAGVYHPQQRLSGLAPRAMTASAAEANLPANNNSTTATQLPASRVAEPNNDPTVQTEAHSTAEQTHSAKKSHDPEGQKLVKSNHDDNDHED